MLWLMLSPLLDVCTLMDSSDSGTNSSRKSSLKPEEAQFPP